MPAGKGLTAAPPKRAAAAKSGAPKFRVDKPFAAKRPAGERPSRTTRPLARSPAREPEQIAEHKPPLPTGSLHAQTVVVTADEDGMRLDRFLRARFATLSFMAAQKVMRTGQVRVDGARVKAEARLATGQSVRIPPIHEPGEGPAAPAVLGSEAHTREFLTSITLFETDDVLVLNKPFGLAVQGGSGTVRHVDGLLEALRDRKGQKPRLVHRIDKDTAGCLVVAKTRLVASELAKSFRSRSARKVYWAVAAGVPQMAQGRVSTYLVKEAGEGGDRMRIAEHGDRDAAHALTYYAVVDTLAQKASWLSLKPVTGRTHQLRAHAAHIGHPILGDPKYFDIENWEQLGGIQNRLHLLARRIVLPLPGGGQLDVSAPLPPHMQQTFNLFGFDAGAYDPIVDAPSD